MLYIRMLFSMLVGLYTSRVILSTLGVEDYGIYNVVGGFVSMFTLLTSSLSSAISRFLTFELGRGEKEKLNQIFSTSVTIQALMALVIFMVTELIGVWFLNTQMNIPSERMHAANWVLQCSILSFVIGLISIPYNAAIIAHEHMTAFAYISIFETLMKLFIVISLYFVGYDKLIIYAILLLALSILIRIIYGLYCSHYFEECHYKLSLDKTLLKEMVVFAGWNFFGNGAHLFSTQGVNILSNMFFGVRVNAAIGIANQVQGAAQQFVNNFTQAVNPQITKSYSTSDFSYMHKLVCLSAKYSYFLMLFFAIPICLETETILSLWLKTFPEYTIIFVRLAFLSSLLVVISNSMVVSILATGDIRKYQIIVGTISFSTFPLSYIAFKLGFAPTASYYIFLMNYFILVFVRLFLVKDKIQLPISMYVREVIAKVLYITILSIPIPYLIITTIAPSTLRLFITCLVSFCCCLILYYTIGMTSRERQFALKLIHRHS